MIFVQGLAEAFGLAVCDPVNQVLRFAHAAVSFVSSGGDSGASYSIAGSSDKGGGSDFAASKSSAVGIQLQLLPRVGSGAGSCLLPPHEGFDGDGGGGSRGGSWLLSSPAVSPRRSSSCSPASGSTSPVRSGSPGSGGGVGVFRNKPNSNGGSSSDDDKQPLLGHCHVDSASASPRSLSSSSPEGGGSSGGHNTGRGCGAAAATAQGLRSSLPEDDAPPALLHIHIMRPHALASALAVLHAQSSPPAGSNQQGQPSKAGANDADCQPPPPAPLKVVQRQRLGRPPGCEEQAGYRIGLLQLLVHH